MFSNGVLKLYFYVLQIFPKNHTFGKRVKSKRFGEQPKKQFI